MNGIITNMLELFEISEIPTDFASFAFWLCSLAAGIIFLKFCVGICFSFINKMYGGNRK